MCECRRHVFRKKEHFLSRTCRESQMTRMKWRKKVRRKFVILVRCLKSEPLMPWLPLVCILLACTHCFDFSITFQRLSSTAQFSFSSINDVFGDEKILMTNNGVISKGGRFRNLI